MKIRCAKCGIEEDLTDDDIKELAHITYKYDPNISGVAYLEILSIIKGKKCEDNERHVFIFHKSFDDAMYDIFKEYLQLLESGKSIDNIIHRLEGLTCSRNVKSWF